MTLIAGSLLHDARVLFAHMLSQPQKRERRASRQDNIEQMNEQLQNSVKGCRQIRWRYELTGTVCQSLQSCRLSSQLSSLSAQILSLVDVTSPVQGSLPISS